MSLRTLPSKGSPFKARNPVSDVEFTIGAETGGNTKAVSLQFLGPDGAALDHRACVYAYLSDDAEGDTILVTAPSGAVAIGTNGLLQVLEAKKQFRMTTEEDGLLDFTIIEAGAKTLYLHVVMPDGTIKSSGAITFA